jgi:hypothetical protein
MMRTVYVAISIHGTNPWISAERAFHTGMVERLAEGSIVKFENVPYTFEVARWEGTGKWEGCTKLHIVDLNSFGKSKNGFANVVDNPAEILEVFNILINIGWELVEYDEFLKYHNL